MTRTALQSLNEGLGNAMASDERVVFLGEDVLDPYGGAFKVSKGLSTRFPDRVLTTPISEAAITGVAVGLALRGMRPVVEIMFGDFLALAADQLLNHAAKYRWMYNNHVRVPLVVRTPMGGRRGYGPTHSQSLEKHFLGMPGLRVVAPNTFSEPGELLRRIILNGTAPTLFIEHKALYAVPVKLPPPSQYEVETTEAAGALPTIRVRVAGAGDAALTIATYGYMAELSLEAMWRLAVERELITELLVLTALNPLPAESVCASVNSTRRLLTVEEASTAFGWGSELIARAAEASPRRGIACARVGARPRPIPSSRTLEVATLPAVDDIMEAATQLVGESHP